MDPFTAIGLASSIVQFIDYSAKITHGAREIYDSGSGMTEDNKSLESVAGKMKELSSKLLPTTGAPRSEDEQALCRVAAECNILSDQILDLLGKIKPKDSKSKRQIALAAVKNKLREREKLELEKRLANCRSQLELQLSFLTRLNPFFSCYEETNIHIVRKQRLGWRLYSAPPKEIVSNLINSKLTLKHSAKELWLLPLAPKPEASSRSCWTSRKMLAESSYSSGFLTV
jgi:hypothetical protein